MPSSRPIVNVQVDVEIKENPDFNRIILELLTGPSQVDIGIHPISGEKLVEIASAHEFGATINHPGGQPFIIVDARKHPKRESRARRSSYLPLPDGKEMIFLRKGKKGMGVTKPHKIVIPMRSFIRSTFDEQRDKYIEYATDIFNKMMDGVLTPLKGLALLGERAQRDIKRKIKSNIPPPNAAETARRKGSDVPLVDTGVLIGSIRYAVKTEKEQTVKMSD